jgi:hypothetical protein
MTSDTIEKYVEGKEINGKPIVISFKQRNNITGIFIQGNDYTELKKKNFWRIVSESKIKEWKQTNDSGLARLFSGTDFTRLK